MGEPTAINNGELSPVALGDETNRYDDVSAQLTPEARLWARLVLISRAYVRAIEVRDGVARCDWLEIRRTAPRFDGYEAQREFTRYAAELMRDREEAEKQTVVLANALKECVWMLRRVFRYVPANAINAEKALKHPLSECYTAKEMRDLITKSEEILECR